MHLGLLFAKAVIAHIRFLFFSLFVGVVVFDVVVVIVTDVVVGVIVTDVVVGVIVTYYLGVWVGSGTQNLAVLIIMQDLSFSFWVFFLERALYFD